MQQKAQMTLMQIGELVRRTLVLRDMTQLDLAERCGLSKDAINSIVNGRRRMGLTAYERVAKELGLTFYIKVPIEEGRKENNS